MCKDVCLRCKKKQDVQSVSRIYVCSSSVLSNVENAVAFGTSLSWNVQFILPHQMQAHTGQSVTFLQKVNSAADSKATKMCHHVENTQKRQC